MVWSGFDRNGSESGDEQVGTTHIGMSRSHNKGHCTGVHIGIKGVRDARNDTRPGRTPTALGADTSEKQETWTREKCMPRGLEKKKDRGDEGNNLEASREQKEVRMSLARGKIRACGQ